MAYTVARAASLTALDPPPPHQPTEHELAKRARSSRRYQHVRRWRLGKGRRRPMKPPGGYRSKPWISRKIAAIDARRRAKHSLDLSRALGLQCSRQQPSATR